MQARLRAPHAPYRPLHAQVPLVPSYSRALPLLTIVRIQVVLRCLQYCYHPPTPVCHALATISLLRLLFCATPYKGTTRLLQSLSPKLRSENVLPVGPGRHTGGPDYPVLTSMPVAIVGSTDILRQQMWASTPASDSPVLSSTLGSVGSTAAFDCECEHPFSGPAGGPCSCSRYSPALSTTVGLRDISMLSIHDMYMYRCTYISGPAAGRY